jgi:hypothetical protein
VEAQLFFDTIPKIPLIPCPFLKKEDSWKKLGKGDLASSKIFIIPKKVGLRNFSSDRIPERYEMPNALQE